MERSAVARPSGVPSTAASVVADHIRSMIFDRRVGPGDRLVAEAIATELGVSRVPVREALRELDGGGLVEVRERRGAIVVTFDRSSNEDLLDLLRVRRCLEPWAAAQAAQHRTADDLERLDAAIAAGTCAAEIGDLVAAGRAHHDVLQSVVAAAHNRHLLDALTPLHNRSAVAFSIVAGETLPDGWLAHREVRDAIAHQDRRRSQRETRSHLDDVIRAISRLRSPWDTGD